MSLEAYSTDQLKEELNIRSYTEAQRHRDYQKRLHEGSPRQCPYCEHDRVWFGTFFFHHDVQTIIAVPLRCDKCKAQWKETFRLLDVAIPYKPELYKEEDNVHRQNPDGAAGQRTD